jgi:CheY-like chemotaxis protein
MACGVGRAGDWQTTMRSSFARRNGCLAPPGETSATRELDYELYHQVYRILLPRHVHRTVMLPPPAHRTTVLLLEDEALIAITLQADLEDAGPFTTCADALSWLGSNKPDLAILDTVLKDGPCKDVALTLASLDVPFLVYSGHAEDLNNLPKLADVTWVEKPAAAEVLLRALAGLPSGVVATA